MYNVVVVVAKRRENKEEEKTYYHCAVPSVHRASLLQYSSYLLFLLDAKEHVALETFADGFPIIRRAPLIVDEKFHLVRPRR